MLGRLVSGKKGKVQEYLPFLCVGIIAVLWHAVLSVSVGDDMVYFKTLLDGRSILEILAHRYETWSSRLGIELVLIPLVHAPMLWRILDVLVFASIPILLDKLLEADRDLRWWIAGFTLLYPFTDMMSAGWISTTTNYLWPLWCILFLALHIKKAVREVPVAWYEKAAGISACAYAASQEQAAALLLVVLVLALIRQRGRKCRDNAYLCVLLGITIAWFAAILLCPGNAVRGLQEIQGRMPEFASFSVWEKLYMGLANMERVFIAELDYVFLMTVLLLAGFVYLKTGDYRKTACAGLPLLVLLGQSVVRSRHVRFANIFVIPEQTTEWNFRSPSAWLPLLFLAVCIGGILCALYWLTEDRVRYLYTVLLLGAGFATGAVMGFSPTIYASANRPYIYLYFTCIFVCLMQMKQMQPVLRREIYRTPGKLAFTVLFVLMLANVADVTWMSYLTGRFL